MLKHIFQTNSSISLINRHHNVVVSLSYQWQRVIWTQVESTHTLTCSCRSWGHMQLTTSTREQPLLWPVEQRWLVSWASELPWRRFNLYHGTYCFIICEIPCLRCRDANDELNSGFSLEIIRFVGPFGWKFDKRFSNHFFKQFYNERNVTAYAPPPVSPH